MSTRYFDAHCHIQFDQFTQDQAALLERMAAEGVRGVVVGCDADTSRKAADLSEQYEHIVAAVGFHPNRIEDEKYDEHLLRNLLMYPKVVAIGECGLDYYRPAEVTEDLKSKQKDVFERQVHLAGQVGRPLIVHARPSKGTMDAYHDALAIIREAKEQFPNLRGDVHFFVGTVEEAQSFVELGFTMSFTAVITFARDYDTVIRTLPLTSILSETDAPYVPPTSRARGSRNDPLAVQDVVAKIAEIRGENEETVRRQLVENAERLFAVTSY
jgi:TatD DNase family protein